VYLLTLDVSTTGIGMLLSVGGLAAVLVRPFMPLATRGAGGLARAPVLAMATVALGVGGLGLVGSYPVLLAAAGFAGGSGMAGVVLVALALAAASRVRAFDAAAPGSAPGG
jgi:hypothetical protein